MLITRDNKIYPPSSIRTYTGIIFELLNPTEDMIAIEDIAHSLSLQCRFTGHTIRHVSIAEHCIWVSQHLPDELKLAGLLHDASEAYLIDVPTPLKKLLPRYKELEEKISDVIFRKFNVPIEQLKMIKTADWEALQHEWDTYMISCILPGEARTHEYWEQLYIEHFKVLNNEI